MDSSIIQITSSDLYFWTKLLAILQNIIIFIINFFPNISFWRQNFIQSNLPITATLGTRKSGCCGEVVVMRRWGCNMTIFVRGEQHVYYANFMPTFCNHGNPIINDHQHTIRIKFPDHSWLVCQSLKKLAFFGEVFLAAGDTVPWMLLM